MSCFFGISISIFRWNCVGFVIKVVRGSGLGGNLFGDFVIGIIGGRGLGGVIGIYERAID